MSRSGFARFCTLTLLAVTPAAVFGQARLVGRFGEAHIGPRRAIVHVRVAVPPGLDGNAVAEEALRGQGARPLSAEFSLTGLKWDEFSGGGSGSAITQNYNAAGEPSGLGAEGVMQLARDTWTDVTTSKFEFSNVLGITARCPSLVKECPGPQTFDGLNDIGWAAISGCCTLAVTWYSTGREDEADMAFNTRFQWKNDGQNYDFRTVALHELGHVLGLGHTPVPLSVMEATYGGVRPAVQEDDRRGVTYLYPETIWIGAISGRVTNIDTKLGQ